jgi:hypothetical protein
VRKSQVSKYVVSLEGRSLLIQNLDAGRPRKLGFFTTRLVEAADSESAEIRAINAARLELASLQVVLNDSTDPPTIEVDEMWEVEEFDSEPPGEGFTYYPETTSP